MSLSVALCDSLFNLPPFPPSVNTLFQLFSIFFSPTPSTNLYRLATNRQSQKQPLPSLRHTYILQATSASKRPRLQARTDGAGAQQYICMSQRWQGLFRPSSIIPTSFYHSSIPYSSSPQTISPDPAPKASPSLPLQHHTQSPRSPS